MCQAYDGEKALIAAGENHATIAGFTVASKGTLQSANPYSRFEQYNRNAWNHGWSCWHEGILPWAIERQYRDERELLDIKNVHAQFRLTRELPADLKRFLHD